MIPPFSFLRQRIMTPFISYHIIQLGKCPTAPWPTRGMPSQSFIGEGFSVWHSLNQTSDTRPNLSHVNGPLKGRFTWFKKNLHSQYYFRFTTVPFTPLTCQGWMNYTYFFIWKKGLFFNCGFSVTAIFCIYAAEDKISKISLIITPSLKSTIDIRTNNSWRSTWNYIWTPFNELILRLRTF